MVYDFYEGEDAEDLAQDAKRALTDMYLMLEANGIEPPIKASRLLEINEMLKTV